MLATTMRLQKPIAVALRAIVMLAGILSVSPVLADTLPQITMEVDAVRVTEKDPVVTIRATPGVGTRQRLDRVLLWVNDGLFQAWQLGEGPWHKQVTLPRDRLRRGPNLLLAQCYNRGGDLGQAKPVEVFSQTATVPRNVHGLFVGVGRFNYEAFADIMAHHDAPAQYALWMSQQGKVYNKVSGQVLLNADVTREKVLGQFRILAKQVQPEDLLVVFLAGQGTTSLELNKVMRQRIPSFHHFRGSGGFVFPCSDFDPQALRKTTIASEDLFQELSRLPCRKLLLVDACHSGQVVVDYLSGGGFSGGGERGVGPVILSSCAAKEVSFEFPELGSQLKAGHAKGLFSIALIETVEKEFDRADRNKDQILEVGELTEFLKIRIPELNRTLTQQSSQNPAWFVPANESSLKLFGK